MVNALRIAHWFRIQEVYRYIMFEDPVPESNSQLPHKYGFWDLVVQAAASMVVNVGSFSDPEGLEGLAHFLGMIRSFLSKMYGQMLRSVYR